MPPRSGPLAASPDLGRDGFGKKSVKTLLSGHSIRVLAGRSLQGFKGRRIDAKELPDLVF